MSEPSAEPFFGPTRRPLLDALLDAVLPGDPANGVPAAGAAGVAEHLEQVVAETPMIGLVLGNGLDAAAARLAEQGQSDLASSSADERDRFARDTEAKDPGFFMTLVAYAYMGYYTRPEVLRALGLAGRAPQPEGYELEAGELGALDKVRARGQLYR